MTVDGPVRLGVVAGHPSAAAYLDGLAPLEGVVPVGVVHPDAAERSRLSAQFALAGYASLPELIDAAHPAFCLIAGQPADGLSLARDALTRGVGVAIEPPLDDDLSAATGLLAETLTDDARMFVLHPAPLLPHVRRIARAINTGRIGRPMFLRSSYWSDGLAGYVPERDASRGLHEITEQVLLANSLMGDRPERLYATAQSIDPVGGVVAGYFTLTITYGRGQTAIVDFGPAHAGAAPYYAVLVTGQTGSLHADAQAGGPVLFRAARATFAGHESDHDERTRALRALVDTASSGPDRGLTDLADALVARRAATATLASIETGQAVELTAEGHRPATPPASG